jgi:hypothetical protein
MWRLITEIDRWLVVREPQELLGVGAELLLSLYDTTIFYFPHHDDPLCPAQTFLPTQVFNSRHYRYSHAIVSFCDGNAISGRRLCFDMVRSHAIASEYWWHHDYAEIPQFNGGGVLYGVGGSNVANVFFALSNVSGGCL